MEQTRGEHMRRHPQRPTVSVHVVLCATVALLLVVTCCGCRLGPKKLNSDWREYNSSIAHTAREQMLLNLVRLRYNDLPAWLNPAGVTTQHAWGQNGQLVGTLFEGPTPDFLVAGGGVSKIERPTVSFLPGGKAVTEGLLSPLTPETLFILSYGGWAPDRLMPLVIKSMNEVQNAPGAGGPVPKYAPPYEEFAYLIDNWTELKRRRLVETSLVEKLDPIFPPIREDALTPSELRSATSAGFVYRPAKQRGLLDVSRRKQVAVLRFAKEAGDTLEYREIVRLLNVQPMLGEYELNLALEGHIRPPMHSPENGREIMVGIRSLWEIMQFLAKGVDIPIEHLECGSAVMTLDMHGNGFDWRPVLRGFQILVSKKKPDCAAVSVKYRGYWYYIDDRDHNSKLTFMLLGVIHGAQIESGGAENLPVLTLPL
jgi:hypothetical protein